MTNNDERPAARFPAAAMAVTILSVVTAVGTVGYFTVGKDLLRKAASSETIPACNSPEVRDLLGKIVSNNSNAFQTRTFIDFSDVVERSYTPNVKRYCAGTLTESGGKTYTGLELTLSSVGEVIGTLVPDYPRGPTIPTSSPAPGSEPLAAPETGDDPEYSYLSPEDLALSPAEKLARFRELGDLGEKDTGAPWTAAEVNEIEHRRIELFDSVRRAAPNLITPADLGSQREAEQGVKEYEP